MNNRVPCIMAATLLAASTLLAIAVAADRLPDAATVLDDKTVMYLRPVPTISPNGQLVAYVNRGWVCVADIEAGTSRRLVEIPNSWAHVFASTDETSAGGDPDSLIRVLGRDKYKELQDQVKNEINMFQWTVESSAIVFSAHSYDAVKQKTKIHIWHAPIVGEPKEIASNEHSTTRRGPGSIMTRDSRFLVGNYGRHRALIWDLATNKPRATPFLFLAPSPTSGRWIGVEKDTRQLVVVDQDFNITDRYEETLPKDEFGFDMIWSPDERFVFWRQQIGFDYYSHWVGCRYDLDTGERQIFNGDYMKETITFTGHRGEFIRVGAAGVQRNHSGLALAEQYVGIVPDGRVHMRKFWSQRADPPGMTSNVRMAHRMNAIWSPDFQLFTIGLPRQEGPYGDVLHLADRQRQWWKLPGDDTGRYVAPYHVAGFALDGKSIVAYDDTRLFVLPVAAIQSPGNKVR